MKITLGVIGKCKSNSPEGEIIKRYKERLKWDLIIKEKDNSTQNEEAKFLEKILVFSINRKVKKITQEFFLIAAFIILAQFFCCVFGGDSPFFIFRKGKTAASRHINSIRF